ncbi:GNAT family N-acetyltransferase [Vallitalea okinawensis]|uniref:GNAT family N-acetyltransferase n=1 Tax=Vallitalea okinawensis TaxID=2078660 RepID=UPI000CFCEF05|nr:GNAT family N-acetyltransferase [Vallitalea okinawensis]
MFELVQKEYKRITPLIKDIQYSEVLIHSVIEGNSPGKIFVDNTDNPRSAYIESDFSFLIGCEDNKDFNESICKYIMEYRINDSQGDELILFLGSSNWKVVEQFLLNSGCIKIQRKTFGFNKSKYREAVLSEMSRSKKIELRKINQKIIDSHKKFKTIEQYPSNFGFCIFCDDVVVSECISVAVGCGQAEISISTREHYRGKGYATIAIIAFIDYCLENNLLPSWSCWPFREESIHLANKLGFEEEHGVPAIYWSRDI